MNQKKTLVLVLLALVLLLGVSRVMYDKLGANLSSGGISMQETSSTQTDTENEPVAAPDFTVLNWEGGEASLSDFQDKPVIINFWASWCGPCKSEMADFDAAYQKWGGEVEFMMINMTDGGRETVDSAKGYVEQEGFSFPVYFDTQYSAAIAYGASALPTTYFIDAEGYAIARAVGPLDTETLEKGIGMILPEKGE